MLLHYRPYPGTPRHPAWAILSIARVALGLLLRRRLFWVLYACALLMFFMFFFGSLLLDWAQSQLTDGPVQLGKMQIDSARAMEFLRQRIRVLSGTRDTYATFFGMQGAVTVIVLCLSGAVLVGNDFAQRGVAFFLAKPIHAWHYLLGKFLAIGVIVNLVTTVPALLLFAQHVSSDGNYLLDVNFFRTGSGIDPGNAGWPLLLGVLGYGLLMTVVLGLLLLATAAWVKRTMPLILVWTSLFLFLRALSQALVDGLKYPADWRLLDLWNSLGLLGQALLGFAQDEVNPKPQPQFWAAALVLGGVCCSCLIFLRRRMRNFEIVRSN